VKSLGVRFCGEDASRVGEWSSPVEDGTSPCRSAAPERVGDTPICVPFAQK
jgi:hypothetical protein